MQLFSPSNKDPRVRRTRQQLHEAFFSLLREKSFDDIIVQDIADRATINRVTFYSHYRDKFELFDDIIAVSFQHILNTQFAKTESLCVKNLVCALCDFLEHLPRGCQNGSSRILSLLGEAKIKSLVTELILARYLTQDPESCPKKLAMKAKILSWSIYGACSEWIKSEQRAVAKDWADLVLPLLPLIQIEIKPQSL